MNDVNLIGNFTKELEYSHTTNNIKFNKTEIQVNRKSGFVDYIPVIIQDKKQIPNGNVYLHGELRVFNCHNHSLYYVYPDYIYKIDDEHMNSIELEGVIKFCSDVRNTPSGMSIKDVMLTVDKQTIPLIFWNKLAYEEFEIGSIIRIIGRIQSREFKKGGKIKRIIEVSVNNLI